MAPWHRHHQRRVTRDRVTVHQSFENDPQSVNERNQGGYAAEIGRSFERRDRERRRLERLEVADAVERELEEVHRAGAERDRRERPEAREVELSESGIRKMPQNSSLLSRLLGKKK